MPIKINERTVEQPIGLFSLLSTIRWEAQFKLAKCCMCADLLLNFHPGGGDLACTRFC